MGIKGRTGFLFFGALLAGGLAVAGVITGLNKGTEFFTDLWPKWGDQSPEQKTTAEVKPPERMAPQAAPITVPEQPLAAQDVKTIPAGEVENREEAAPAPSPSRPRLLVFEPSNRRRFFAPSSNQMNEAPHTTGLTASTDATALIGARPLASSSAPSTPAKSGSSASGSTGGPTGSRAPSNTGNTIAVAPSAPTISEPSRRVVEAPVPPVAANRPVPVQRSAIIPPSEPTARKMVAAAPIAGTPTVPTGPVQQTNKAFVVQPKQQQAMSQDSIDVAIIPVKKAIEEKVTDELKQVAVAANTTVGGILASTIDPVNMNPDIGKIKTANEEPAVKSREVASNEPSEPLRLVPSGMDFLQCGETLRPDLVGEVAGVIMPEQEGAASPQLLFVDLGPPPQEKENPSCEMGQLTGRILESQLVTLEKNYLWTAKLAANEGDWVAAFLVNGSDRNTIATVTAEKEMKNLVANPNVVYLTTFLYDTYNKPDGKVPKPKK